MYLKNTFVFDKYNTHTFSEKTWLYAFTYQLWHVVACLLGLQCVFSCV